MNLNDLSENELNELENYINKKVKKKKPEIVILFNDLRTGKLKNRNVDSDALDFVYDGLTELVESWTKLSKTLNKNIKLITLEDASNLEQLFKRSLKFNCEENSHMQEVVKKLLEQNNYPKRSKKIKISGVQEPNEKFIKDGFIYLFRGAEAGQMSGFFAYPYCQSKLNLEEYCKRNPCTTPDDILEEHGQIGNGYFISATTKLPLTTKFCYKVGDKSGSIYILKMKLEEIYRLPPHKPKFLPDFINAENFNEEEYVIPDYVMPNELVEEFEYTDYMGVYRYLTEVIGLKITPQDIGFSENIEKEKNKFVEEGDFFRETEEKIIEDWKNNDFGKMFETLIKEFDKKIDSDERE